MCITVRVLVLSFEQQIGRLLKKMVTSLLWVFQLV